MMMSMRNAIVLLLWAAAAVACKADGEGPEPGSGQIPAALLGVEGDAEHAFDQALAGDVAGVRVTANLIDVAWRGFRAEARADGAMSADLDAMDAAVAQLIATAATSSDGPLLARAANRVSATMDELFTLYAPTVPPAILVLDYLGREVVLDGMTADFARATADLEVLEQTWGGVRPAVVAAGGSGEANGYDASIAALRARIAAADGAGTVTEAQAGLEIVDAVEKVFP